MRWVGRHTERAHVGCGLLISLYTRRTPFRSSSSGHGSVLTVKFSLVSWRAPSVRLWSRFTLRCRLRLRRICFWWVRFRSERGEEQNSQESRWKLRLLPTQSTWDEKYLTCCGSCGSWRGVLQPEPPSGRAPPPARCRTPPGPADGRSHPARWSWSPEPRASTDADAV